MFVPFSEVSTEHRPGGEERNYFYFYQRANLPIEIVITRLPPFFEADSNWHRHRFVQEYSVPLTGEILIKELQENQIKEKRISDALLKDGEWIVGIECKDSKRATLLIEKKNGKRSELTVDFKEEHSEGKEWHTVGNPTTQMVTMLTLKRVPRSILKKDSLVFRVDREKYPDYRSNILR